MIDYSELHELADGQLSPEDAARVEARIGNCPESNAEYKAILAAKSAARRLTETVTCEETWKACRRRLDEIDGTRRVEWFVGRYAWGITSVFLCLILGAGLLNRGGSGALRTADVARMVSSLAPGRDAPRAAEPETMQKWVKDYVGHAPVTIQFDQLRVIAAAEGAIEGRRVVRLTLQDRFGYLTLVVIPDAEQFADLDAPNGADGFRVGQVGRVPCVAWTDGGFALVVMADRSPTDLIACAEGIRVR